LSLNPRQAHELLIAVTYTGPLDRGRHLRGFFAVLYYAGLRPAEAAALRLGDCELPEDGWGYLTLAASRPETNRRWTDTGTPTNNAASNTAPPPPPAACRSHPNSSVSYADTSRSVDAYVIPSACAHVFPQVVGPW